MLGHWLQVRDAPKIVHFLDLRTFLLGWSDYVLADLTAVSPNSNALEMWRARRDDDQEASRLQDSFREISLECDFDIDPDPESISEDWML